MKVGERAERLKRRGSKEKGRIGVISKGGRRRLNIELDLQSLFGLHVCTAVLTG